MKTRLRSFVVVMARVFYLLTNQCELTAYGHTVTYNMWQGITDEGDEINSTSVTYCVRGLVLALTVS